MKSITRISNIKPQIFSFLLLVSVDPMLTNDPCCKNLSEWVKVQQSCFVEQLKLN